MPPSETFYDVLDVPPSASSQEIKAAYRRLARKYHPDINPDNTQAEARFKAINEAYATLSSEDKRQQYNLKHHIAAQKTTSSSDTGAQKSAHTSKSPPPTSKAKPQPSASQQRSNPKASNPRPQEKPTSGKSAMDADKFKAFFDTMFAAVDSKMKPPPAKPQSPPPAQETPHKPQPQRGEDITLDLRLTTDEVKQGLIKTVHVEQSETCKRCSGTGKVSGSVCTQCQGERKTTVAKKITVKVPAGVKEGSKVRVAKEGTKGSHGGEPGDLYLTIHIQVPQSTLRIEGINAYCDLDISVPEAVLGGDVAVSTPSGSTRMTIPAHTQPGQTFRLKGQGVTSNGQTGDLFVTVKVVIPSSLTAQERQLYEELARHKKH